VSRRSPVGHLASVGVAASIASGALVANGDYAFEALVALGVGLALAAAGIVGTALGVRVRTRDVALASFFALVWFLWAAWSDRDPIGRETEAWITRREEIASFALILASYVPSLFFGVREGRLFAEVRFAIAAAFATKVGLDVFASTPEPRIDVFRILQDGVHAHALGRNPYEAVRVPGGPLGVEPYAYAPGALYATRAAFELFGDVRVAALFGVVVGGIAVRYAGLVAAPGRQAFGYDAPALLLWLFPKGPMVLQRAWVDPIAFAPLGLAALALVLERRLAAAVLVGLAVSVKQTNAALALVALVALAPRVRELASGALALAAVVAPLALRAREPFVYATYTFHDLLPPRYDSLNLMAHLWRERAFEVPARAPFAAFAAALALITLAVVGSRSRGGKSHGDALFFLGSAFALASFFALGKQNFLNYEHFVFGLVVLGMPLFVRAAERPNA
jgi:hypothetical protein